MGSGASSEIGGVRVFKVSPGGPAFEAGLEVFFDFIVAVAGVPMVQGPLFAEKIQEHENKQVKLTVFNTRANLTREVTILPRKWGGSGLLGATVRYDTVDPAENHGVRVLEVFPNSPAAHAGLVPFQDYLLGTSQKVFYDIDELVDIVSSSINERMQVLVYNADSETVREVILVPNNDWGGDGCIGCDIGTGLLHRIPSPRRAPGSVAAGYSPAAPSMPANGLPAISPTGGWTPPQGVSLAAQHIAAQASAPVAPNGAAQWAGAPQTMSYAAPGMPGMQSMQGMPSVPGMPSMPGAPMPVNYAAMPNMAGMQGVPAHGAAVSMPAISPTGAWSPAAQMPVPAYETPAQYQQDASPAGMGYAAAPRAPPSTPMNISELPGSVDLSAVMDPAKYAGLASPSASPLAGAPQEFAMAAPQPNASALL